MTRKLAALILVVGSLALAGCVTAPKAGEELGRVPDCVQGRVC